MSDHDDRTDAPSDPAPPDGPDALETPGAADAPGGDPGASDAPSGSTSQVAGPSGGGATEDAPPPPPPPPAGGQGRAAGRPSPYDPSHPSGLSESVRNYGMFTHLAAFGGALVTLAFVGPLILWLIRREEHPFLDHHGKEAVNFNLSLLLYGVVGMIATFITFGLGLLILLPGIVVFFVLWVVFTIQAAVRASRGEGYRYPLTIRFIPD